jgi:hypothetical protein
LQRGVELGVGEGSVERDDRPIAPLVIAHLEAMGTHLGQHRRLSDERTRARRIEPRRVAGQHERGVDHDLRLAGTPSRVNFSA